jgi:molybdenum cofactor cytidylyltransferase
MPPDTSIAILILAAGASTRLGQPKQQLRFKGTPLLVHTVRQAKATTHPVAVVLGSNADAHHKLIEQENVTVVTDTAWHLGMGHSLKFGLQSLISVHPNLAAVVISVCDQPFLTTGVFHQLLATKAPLAACTYNRGWGVPALFSKPYFPKLLALADVEGAKKVLLNHEAAVDKISFPFGDVDVDTPDDLANLLEHRDE